MSNSMNGLITREEKDGSATKTISTHWISQKTNYVSGGVIFMYPEGTFISPPQIQIAVELVDLSYTDQIIITPMITQNLAESTTVMVNILTISLGIPSISEAHADSVRIHLHAIGQ